MLPTAERGAGDVHGVPSRVADSPGLAGHWLTNFVGDPEHREVAVPEMRTPGRVPLRQPPDSAAAPKPRHAYS
jgi:hypothetical protein